jgi:hypothetical protein
MENNMFRKIRLGLTDLPGYGPHPGTAFLILFPITNGIWLIQYGKNCIVPMILSILFVLPIYLVGAYGRGNDWLKENQNKPV